jgi:hypothetical protein
MIPVEDVARRIAERLRDILPVEIGVDSDTSGLIRIRSVKSKAVVEVSLASVTDDPAYENDYGQALQRAGRGLLSTIQDFVAEELAQPWPHVTEGMGGEMATPDASVLDETLCLWYGDRTSPISMICVPLTA